MKCLDLKKSNTLQGGQAADPSTFLAEKLIEEHLRSKGLTEFAFIAPEQDEASETVRSIAVVLFPYFPGRDAEKGNLSLYCQGLDYHVVVPRYLEPIGEALKELIPDLSFHVYADTGPFNDRSLALRAGLGIRGVNQMLIHPKYGSYFFIACMTLSVPLTVKTVPVKESTCLECGRCVKACPGGCLGKESFDYTKCRSYITQKKGTLEPWEEEILQKDDLVFGCDLCQTVCPMNQNVEKTPIKEFTKDRIISLRKEDLAGLSNKTFKEKYPDRAFTWRGPGVIVRNLELLEK